MTPTYVGSSDPAVRTPNISDRALVAGRSYWEDGRVTALDFEPGTGLLRGKVTGSGTYNTTAKLVKGLGGSWSVPVGICSCPVRQDCKHVAALIFAAEADARIGGLLGTRPELDEKPEVQADADWEKALRSLLPEDTRHRSTEAPPLALQFELEKPLPRFSYRGRREGVKPVPKLNVRPVLLGAKGKWIRTGIAWNTLNYLNFGRKFNEEHLDWLIEFLQSHSPAARQLNAAAPWLPLNSFSGRNLWTLLADAERIGLRLILSGPSAAPVRVLAEPAEVQLDVGRSGSSVLALTAKITAAGQEVPAASFGIIGRPAQGLFYTLDDASEEDAEAVTKSLTLAPLAGHPSDAVLGFATKGSPVHIPASDEARFLSQYYPQLKRTATIVSTDESVELPQYAPPVLSLLANYGADHTVRLHWEWHYAAGNGVSAQPLWPHPGDKALRDEAAEERILASVGRPWETVQSLGESPNGIWGEPRLRASATLRGLDTLAFTESVLPGLANLADVTVETAGEVADYREATEAPVVRISTEQSSDRDWFDLGIVITLEGEPVSFAAIFSALAAGHTRMLLPSGAHFSLDLPELQQLRELIDEARTLSDVSGESLRISRFQASLWEELAQLGIVDQQAAEWRSTISGLLRGRSAEPHPFPAGLNASLRPYQLEGFQWLRFLYDSGLGGILADDMGLGKTLQTLALMCSVKESAPAGSAPGPFLVVAPTSVVGNWAAEAARFAPGLRTAAVTSTFAKSGTTLTEVLEGADILITSYALFRIDFEEYSAKSWAGLVLDEAQFVKNHQSKAYQCARKLAAPFKLAITGTPMENNLMELWSLTSIVAPGLFPSPKRFAEFYQKPIEKTGSGALVDKLRARVKPLMLRRTKEQVIKDLPPKQEQILEVVLNPRHQKVYQTHLQRERQKILGLLEDVNKNRFTIFQSLTLLRQLSLDASLVDESLSSVRSSKLDVLFEQLEDVIGEGHRALIFSQFTGFLGKVRQRLDAEGISYSYLDGATRNRMEVVEKFKSGTDPLFLISLKAGGFGLNLTEADYVFLLDPWWNPATEAQAVDRTHRIGQAKNVMVYRLVAKDTIEEKVMALKTKKSQLFSDVMAGESLGTALTTNDLAALFDD